MNEYQLPIITLQSINRKVKFQHRLDQSKKIKFITWHDIIDIIELYEPTADLKKIMIQAKPVKNWQYLTNEFIAKLKDCCNPFHIRYKTYQKVNLSLSVSETIENSIKMCEQKLAYYEDKFDIHKMDINIFWASPVRNQERKNVISWGLCPDYINQVCQVLKTCKKKAFLQINLFNSDCFKRDQYSIVYLICHVECQTKTGVVKEYLMGEKREGKCGRLSPQLINDKLRDKKIELLIFHSSCSNYHIEAIKNCKGIKNIISINANPIYRSDRVRFFLQRFFTKLINCTTIKNSYNQSVKELDEKFPNDRMCCCYHQHTNIDCPFHQYQANFRQFTFEHYNLHKRKANQNLCCICFLQANEDDLKQKHRLERKYEIVKVSDDFNDKKFQFQEGELKGDVFLLNSFKTAEGILGNRHILNELIYTFQKESDKKYKIFNIYNKMCQDKQMFIVSHVNFLMRRKILTTSIRIQKLQKLNKQNIEQDPKLIYTYYCQSISHQQLMKISKLQINILIVSQQRIKFDDFNLDLSINAECGSADIRPFNSKECCNYIKADRHLTEDLKTKVGNFFNYVYKQQFSFIYYPTNFDYMSLMEQISKSVYEPANQVQQFKSIVSKIQQEKLLQHYIILMTIFTQQELTVNKKIHHLHLFKRLFFWYNKITEKQTQSIVEIVKFNIKYFHLVYQISFKYIIQFLLDILKLFNRIATIPQYQKQSFQKRGMGLYEATTLSRNSLVSIFLKQQIESCRTINIPNQLYQVLTENVNEDKIKSILNFTKRVLESFYLYDSLEEDKQIYKSRKGKNKYVQKINSLDKQQQIKMQNQNIKRKQMEMERNAKKVEPQKNKKHEVLKYCTLIINNVIIFRRNNKDIATLDDEQDREDREEYSIQNLAQYRKITSFSPQIKNSQWDNVEDADDNQIDVNVYTQQHFIRKQAGMSRYSLLEILAKVVKKRPFSKTSIISHSLSIQLLLEIFFTDYNEDESPHDILKREMGQIEGIINRSVDISEMGKVRYLFDSMMLQLLVGTKCFREKITPNIFQNVENRCKRLVVYGNFKTKNSFIHNFLIQISSIFKNLSSNDEIHEKLKNYLEIYDSTIRSYEGQKLVNKMVEVINNWCLFKDSIAKINSSCSVNQRNTAYLKIYELKTRTEQQIKDQERGKIWIDRNTYRLLKDLDGRLSAKLTQMKDHLLIFFVCEVPGKQKFFIDHDRILSKDFQNPQSSTNINRVGLFNNNRFQPIIRMKLQFNEKNLKIVSQRGGCKYLILQASNQFELIQRLKKKDNAQVCIQDLRTRLNKLAFSYLFLCFSQGDKLYSLLRQENKQLKVTQFNLKNVYVAEEIKSALMVNLSVFIANKIHMDNKQFVREGSSPSIKSQSQLRTRQAIQIHYKGKPKENTQIIKQVRSLLSTSLNRDELEYIFESEHKPYQVWLNEDLIVQKYYTAIKSIQNSLQPNFKRNYEIKKSSKFEQLNLQVFIECFQIYMKNKYKHENNLQNNNQNYDNQNGIYNYNYNYNYNENSNQNSSIQFFVFQDEDSKINNSNKEQTRTRLFQQILQDKNHRFFNTYHSDRRMLVILKNLTPYNKTSWMNQVIKILFLSDQKYSKAHYVQIQKIPCLIVLLGDKDDLKERPGQ